MGKYAGFEQVELTKPQRSDFDRSHFKRLTTRMGRLTPVVIQEAVPSDTWHGNSEILLRLMPLLAPIYDQIELYVHFWFVPNRLLWEDWEEFITGGRLGVGIDPVTAPVPPFMEITDILGDPNRMGKSSLFDYLAGCTLPAEGHSAGEYAGIKIDAMPFAAYDLVYNEFYRDRNFISDQDVDKYPMPSGDVYANFDYIVDNRTRSYLHDYFTSALPFTQRGAEVLMPVSLGGVVPIYADPVGSETSAVVSAIAQPGSISVGYGVTVDPETAMDGKLYVKGEDFDGTSTTIQDFRSAYALQVWLERNAIGGSRYTESTQAHFGVKPQDSRLQRPEYIGGGRIPVKISEVVSTAYSTDQDDAVVPLANLGGYGVTFGDTNRFSYFCTEHGFILGVASIMNPPSYHQGLPRMFRRRTFLDYPWPTFAKLGEQPVEKAELFASPANLTEDTEGNLPLFGYQSRYADWKYQCSSNHGEFHDTYLHWTLTRHFSESPELGSDFNNFQDDTQDRIFVIGGPNNDNFLMYVRNNLHVRRPLPYYGKPNTLGFV